MTHPFEPPVHETTEFLPRKSDHCVCIVTWNEGDRLREELRQLRPFLDKVDVIIADGRSSDGSTDPEDLRRAGVRALLVTDERGLSTATRMGLAYAIREGYEGAITIDGNGKDGVDAIPRFVEALKNGFDLVQGSRFMKGGSHRNTPPLRLIGVRMILVPITFLGCGIWYTDPTNAFRGMSRRLLIDPRVQPIRKEFIRFHLQHYLIYRAARLGFRVTQIPVARVYPDDGFVPTKIHGLRGNAAVLTDLIRVILGWFNPD